MFGYLKNVIYSLSPVPFIEGMLGVQFGKVLGVQFRKGSVLSSEDP